MKSTLKTAAFLLCAIPAIGFAQETTDYESTTTEQTTTTTTEPAKDTENKGGLFVEPFVLASREDISIKTSQLPIISDDTSGTAESAGIGARLGFHIGEAVFLAADGRYRKTRITDSSYGTAEGDSWSVGPTLGVQAPFFGLRVWGTALALGSYDPQAGNSSVDVKFEEPRGYRAGVGFRVAAVSVNVEYQDLSYGRTDIQSFGPIANPGSTDVDFENKGWTASLSFPIQL